MSEHVCNYNDFMSEHVCIRDDFVTEHVCILYGFIIDFINKHVYIVGCHIDLNVMRDI